MRRMVILVLLAMVGRSASAAPTATVVVFGQGDSAIDRQAIQDAIDAAAPGSTVQLVGTFALDGERILLTKSGLTLVGEAIDDDGDGRVQEDWGDGRDNDGDGSVDEDGWETVLRGVANAAGRPVLSDGVNGLFNRAFVMEGAVPAVEGLVVRDLHFTTFSRAIELIPEWASPTGRCEDRTHVEGSARRVIVERSRFENNRLGITMLGDVSDSEIRGNVFERNSTFGVIVEGELFGCPLGGGGVADLALARPRRVSVGDNLAVRSSFGITRTDHSTVEGNHSEATTIALFSFEDRRAGISFNTTQDCVVGIIVLDGGEQVHIHHNTVSGALIGIDLVGPVGSVQVMENRVEDSEIGILLESDASGYRLIENAFSGSLFVDVLLDFGSSDNFVVNEDGPPITVLDFGTGNRFEGDVIFF